MRTVLAPSRNTLRSPNRGTKAIARQVSAPVKGINAISAYDSMDNEDAVYLQNWFPAETYLETRLGYESFCDTEEGDESIETLAEYQFGQTSAFLAAVDGVIYDVSTGTASSLATGFTENRWQTQQFNQVLILVNGTDTPQSYDGSSMSDAGFSGTSLTSSDLIDVLGFKSRLYFVEKETQSFWYGGLNAVTGTLTEFDLSEVGAFKGNLVTLQSITQDGGDGVDDLFVAIFSEGDVALYSGTDPGSNFTLIGTFKIGRPIGQRPAIKIGSDVAVLTEDGYILLTEVLPFGRVRTDRSFSDRFKRIVREAIEDFKTNEGWEIAVFPQGSKLFVNVPVAGSRSIQHVMNTNTKAWTIFAYADNPVTWGIFQGSLYFGGRDGVVYKAETGNSDNGEDIEATAQAAWNYLGNRRAIKRYTDARPIFELQNDTSANIALVTDFSGNIGYAPMILNAIGASNAVWGVAVWGVDTWGGGTVVSQDWQGVTGVGYAASLAFKVSSNAQRFRWLSTTYVYEPGGII